MCIGPTGFAYKKKTTKNHSRTHVLKQILVEKTCFCYLCEDKYQETKDYSPDDYNAMADKGILLFMDINPPSIIFENKNLQRDMLKLWVAPERQ